MSTTHSPDEVLAFWFPDTGHENDPATHGAFWDERMQGGMDEAICARFGPLTEAAARGELDHWADTERGRLALLIVLDQFPRSLWRDTPAAFGQDIKACRLALDTIAAGGLDMYAPWEAFFFIITIGHCEGPDHLARFDVMDQVTETIVPRLPDCLSHLADGVRAQNARVRGVIERFGRHPHRNPIYGRISTPEEEAYIADGDFPHLKRPGAGEANG
ncbi:MAG: DUF924 domain-containing protein [Silicimonas sp.]|jgi:uncharacterized protein (DUF924 family)|nr:DUF924 domain-containing protein [Silicimonas sp.]